ncbi:Myotubularin-related protein 2 [Heterostelium album PN500]|uniref:Myotubularin-related protein 2 n=1 Tax=Heterostelium pallidum (strain ATCC 26659 / Pp 5 / PN500) TaxID=670386 RepID=D3AZU4_HETP5|nr:Myotubularin-related protein 2 [Heterostelium album PN500]EFA84568.1 Myotubularin-related protein 2 [Heterostelium album PN500]|eukprot:XP_020436681.1 Myotubularin-related protein 2 [Heterostelium album PN500]
MRISEAVVMDHLNPYQSRPLVVYIKIYPWDDRQTINVDSHTTIGEITVFYKQTGRSMKISDMEEYALFKPLESSSSILSHNNNNTNSNSNHGHSHGHSESNNDHLVGDTDNNNKNSLDSNNNSSNEKSSHRVKLKSSSVMYKKRVRLANDQCLMSYNIGNGEYLDLRQVDQLETSVPRWFYKTIVPSNQLETLLRENVPHSRSNSITEIVDSIKASRTLTIGSPSRGGSGNNHNNGQPGSVIPIGGIGHVGSGWQFALPSQHKRVYDVVHRIESQFPSALPNCQLIHAHEDRWEAKINSSEDAHIKRLAMDDSITQETVKQEYIEFALRFEKRTALLLGVQSSLLVWIEPIHSYFTLCFSENSTVHDAICFIVQYIYPTQQQQQQQQQQQSSSTDPNSFGLYLQESSDTRPLPLQHKQLLTNCKLNNQNRLEDSIFLFKAKQQKKKSVDSHSVVTTVNPLTLSQTTLILDGASEDSDDEDEGYNLTVLFPSHQTYRQFHFNPHRTVNEIIQSIVSATTPPPSIMSTSTSSLSPALSSDYSGNTSSSSSSSSGSKANSPTLSSNRNSISAKPMVSPTSPLLVEQSSITSINAKSNTIFENQSESSGFCLYYQKSGSGVWMEGHRTLKSYNLPNEAVVEFKPTPTICKMTLVEGFRNTIKLYCNLQTFIVVYGQYTMITDLKQLLIDNCTSTTVTTKDLESYELFLVKGTDSIDCINNVESFNVLNIDNHIDILEFKPSNNSTVMKDLELFAGARIPITIAGESIENRTTCDRYVQGQMKKGTLYLTNYRVIFEALNRSSYDDFGTKDDCDIPITSISKLKHLNNNQTEITCKDFRVCVFSLNNPSIWEKIKNRLESYEVTDLFAFANAEPYDPSLDTIYNVEDEFLRLQFPVDNWRITYANRDYSLCPTYPSLFVVPVTVTDDDLKKISLFREKGRVPAICWIHKTHKSTITRCSQPRVGIFKSKCNEDEEYLNIITRSNTNSPVLYVMDSRPMANAKANTLLGKGHEDTSLYQNVELQFLGIGNIHVMRDSYKKLYNLIQLPETSNWLSMLDGTQWLEHIYQIINSANIVVEMVDKKGSSVLTHCSDGWDRTSQLVALSQLLLDPYYRTYRGFQVLIEKEWLSFGHQFTHRCAHVHHEKNDEEFSPIFLMFIDAVWQLTNLFPTTFQFNEKFLITILESVYNCRYGTFLFNHQKERVLYTKRNGGLASLWMYLNSNEIEFTNYFFIDDPKPIFHNFFLSDIQFWNNYYFRYKENYKQRVVINESIVKLVGKNRKEDN